MTRTTSALDERMTGDDRPTRRRAPRWSDGPALTEKFVRIAALLACLVAFGLRLMGTADLHFWGDSAYSVYAAHRDLLTIATERTTDGHPPLYYYLLHVWMGMAGDSETPVRFLSLLAGVLTVALTYRLGALTFGPLAGVVACWLAALSPYLVYYSRLPRMYSLLALCGVVATVLLLEMARRPSLRLTGLYSLAVLAGAFSHYYGVLIPVAHGLAVPFLSAWGRNPKAQSPLMVRQAHHERPEPAQPERPEPAYHERPELAQPERANPFALSLSKGQHVRRAGTVRLPILGLHWFLGSAVAGLLTLPWVLYAFLSSAQTTGGIISNAPWPPTVAALLEQLWLVAWTGEMVPLDRARLLTWGPVLALGVGLSALCIRSWRDHRINVLNFPAVRGALALVATIAVPVLVSIPIFWSYPYFVRPRFFIMLIPLALVLAAGTIVGLARTNRPGAALLTSALLLSAVFGLRDTYYLERNILEPDALEISQYLREHSRPGDGVLLHAFWHGGYVRSRLKDASPTFYPLREVAQADLDRLFQKHGRVWLIMYQTAPRFAEYPLEEWLDRNAYRARMVWLEQSRLLLYTRPAVEAVQPFTADFDGQIALTGVTVGQQEARPGDLLAVGLHWRALARPAANYTTFVQLLDNQGRWRAGEDAEPLHGLTHTAAWTPGTEVVQRQGVPVPRSLPPGQYTLITGLYRQDNGQRLALRQPDGAQGLDFLTLATITVYPPAAPPQPAHPTGVRFTLDGQTITLLGYDGPQDRWHARTRQEVETATGGVTLTFRRPALSPETEEPFTFYWQVNEPLRGDDEMVVRLQGERGQPTIVQQGPPQGGAYPTTRWQPGEIVLDERFVRPEALLPPGDYTLQVGIFRPGSDGGRVWAAPAIGPAVDDGFVTVDRLTIPLTP